MINRWIITGDTHGRTETRLKNIELNYKLTSMESVGVIILGDAGINYYLNNTDKKWKKVINNLGIYVYCVRGNHEARPQDIEGMTILDDENVGNFVLYEPNYPYIRYFLDGASYNLVDGDKTHKALVLGGAYSVDKHWRLQNGATWFSNEQLSQEEMRKIESVWDGCEFDLILSHTCPISWQPTDLFLGFIDQSQVDNSMEKWMEEFKDKIKWDAWLFGHYHDDRIVRPHVEMYFNDYEDLSEIVGRWHRYDESGELDWWLKKDPNFYMGV